MATANSASSSRQSSFIFKKSYLYENRFTMGGAFLRICRRRRFPTSVSFEQADYYNLPMSMRNFAISIVYFFLQFFFVSVFSSDFNLRSTFLTSSPAGSSSGTIPRWSIILRTALLLSTCS